MWFMCPNIIPIIIKFFGRTSFIFQRADLAISDLTITSERQEAIDFTTPFMNLGKISL